MKIKKTISDIIDINSFQRPQHIFVIDYGCKLLNYKQIKILFDLPVKYFLNAVQQSINQSINLNEEAADVYVANCLLIIKSAAQLTPSI